MKKQIIQILSIIFILTSLISAKENEIIKHVTIGVGEETVIKIPDLTRISNSGDIVEDIILNDGESIMLRGLAWGDTVVTGWNDQGTTFVYKIYVEMPKYVKELKQFLHEIEGVKVTFLGKNIIVEGQLLRKSDIPKLKGILNNFPEVKNMVDIKVPKPEEVLIDAMKGELYNYNLKFDFAGEGVMFEGNVFSNEALTFAEDTGNFYFDSTYPAIKVLHPEVTFAISLYQINTKEKGSPFATYLSKQINNEDLTEAILYPLFKSKNSNQANSSFKKHKGVKFISKHSKKIASETNLIQVISKNNETELLITIMPKVISDKWLDTNLDIIIKNKGKEIFKTSKRTIMRKGQGIAVSGIMKLIQTQVNETELGLIKNIDILSKCLNFPEQELAFLVTPTFQIRNQ